MTKLTTKQRNRLARLTRAFGNERRGSGYFLSLLAKRLETTDPRRPVELAVDGEPASCADLFANPDFAGLDRDEDGNPVVWLNRYECCESEWNDTWSSTCEDVCPECGQDGTPVASDWLGPTDPELKALWKRLPDAGFQPDPCGLLDAVLQAEPEVIQPSGQSMSEYQSSLP